MPITVTNSVGRQVRLSRKLRRTIRAERGVGWTLPPTQMYTAAYGIVPNTPANRMRYLGQGRDIVSRLVTLPIFTYQGQAALVERCTYVIPADVRRMQNAQYDNLASILRNAQVATLQPDEALAPIRNLAELQRLLTEDATTFSWPAYRCTVRLQTVCARVVGDDWEIYRNTEFFDAILVGVNGRTLADVWAQVFTILRQRMEEVSYVTFLWVEEASAQAFRYTAVGGGSYFPFCQKIRAKKAVINVKNTDDYCALWSYCAWKYPAANDRERCSKYKAQFAELLPQVQHLEWPMKPENLKILGRILGCTFNVLVLDEDERIVPRIIAGDEASCTLYLEEQDGQQHYGLVSNLGRLCCLDGKSSGFPCIRCMQVFTTCEALETHKTYCKNQAASATIMPEPGSKVAFAPGKQSHWVPTVCYADFECLNQVSTQKDTVSEHVPCSAGLYVSVHGGQGAYTDWIGPEAPDMFLQHLFTVVLPAAQAQREQATAKIDWSQAEKQAYKQATECWICGGGFSRRGNVIASAMYHQSGEFKDKVAALEGADKEAFNARKVRDHCHITGRPRHSHGAAHALCNFQSRQTGRRSRDPLTRKPRVEIPVFCHNMTGYDSNIIVSAYQRQLDRKASWLVGQEASCIALTREKFKCFTIGPFRFLDSCAFLPASLATLLEILPPEDAVHQRECDLQANGKGIFPYEWLDCFEKLQQPMPRDIDAYDSHISASPIHHLHEGESVPQYLARIGYPHAANYDDTADFVENDVDVAQWIINQVADEFPTTGQYLMHYQKIDVVGLADVFDAFRRDMFAKHALDPANFLSLPQLSWQCMLRQSGKPIELISDPDMYLMAESGIRGGISCISRRYAKATAGECELLYTDANNLYGHAMMQKLPSGNYRWAPTSDYDRVMALPGDGDEGALLCVDLEYPASLHARDYDYPLAEVHREPNPADFSELQRSLQAKSYKPTRKLMADFKRRTRYTVHWRMLQYLVDRGLIVTQVHGILLFTQTYVMRDYIVRNTEMRARANTEFGKVLPKNLNNSVFGKAMECVRGRNDVRICAGKTGRNRLRKFVNSPLFKDANTDFGDNFALCYLHKPSVVLDKPILIGQAILDLAKLHMHRAHDQFVQHFGRDNIELCMTDTDSLCYLVKTADLSADLARDDFHLRVMDTSNYPRGHPLLSSQNKKQVGFMKNEHPEGIDEFIGLGAKCYHLALSDGSRKVTAKGVQFKRRIAMSRDVFHTVLSTHETHYETTNGFRAEGFQIRTYEMRKAALTAFDDKRFILPGGIRTLPYQ